MAITDDIIERWAQDAEQGIYHGEAGELTINKAIGRPALYEEAMIPITIRIPKSLEHKIQEQARYTHTKFSQAARTAVILGTEARDKQLT
ncbi:toxin-antitoxin system antitoxin subunit [Bifidobacterium sp.]|jgi:predicted transcriptional regulator|uniref:toxin-antitoxin system antitoxin subunit n=1 Tax=Bifidobacterium sp. TaxID=41200 RepID=UPI0025C2D0B3|nr:toxin-antitoxin system antitoxin subunit [Bifidobacterium sp.]MCI1636183.1 toxin-antitoxin system antitoxin subunit [Bifidobacterium sp.]